MKRVFEYIRPYRWAMILGLALKFIAAMFNLIIPSLLEKIIDEVAPKNSPGEVFMWGGIMALCAVSDAVINITANRMATTNTSKVTLNIRHDLFAKIEGLSSAQTDKFTIPSLISRLTTDTYHVNDMLVRTQRLGVRAPVLLLGGIIIALTMDAVLTLVLIGMLPVIAIVVYIVTKKGIPLYVKCQKILDRLVLIVQENAVGVRVIKALSKTKHEQKRFLDVNENLAGTEFKASLIMGVTNPAATIVLNIGLTLVIVVGAFRINSALTEPGVIIAFLSYFTIILNAMLGITRIFVVISRGMASADRIAKVLDAPNEEIALLAEKETEAGDENYHIEMEDVSFSYNGIENNIEHVSFKLKKGQTLGIIGATGSGKSTIINLLMRFYVQDSGVIRINGKDTRTMEPNVVRKRFGVAFQNDFLMADTIRENVDFGRNLDDDAIKSAIVHAQGESILLEKEDGIEHRLTLRGANISGGQKQRLIIARALAANPEILVLDDSSSALDYRTDAKLRQELKKHYSDVTSVVIAQRASSIMGADLILMLDDGRVIGSGTHERLYVTCPEYRDICDTQMGGVANA